MEKKRYDVKIADVEMSIISDEREEFVMKLVDQLDEQIRDITIRNKRCSKMDAAILVALDQTGEHIKAEKRVRNLETQIALYDANLRRMREENIKLKDALLKGKNAEAVAEITTETADKATTQEEELQLEITEETAPAAEPVIESHEDKLRRIADLMQHKKDETQAESEAKVDKIRELESFLKNRGEN